MFFGKKKEPASAWTGEGREKRVHPRLSLKTLITVRTRTMREAHCKLQDLSLGGLAFLSPFACAPQDLLTVTIPPPEGVIRRTPPSPVIVEARVCRVVPSPKVEGSFRIGVKFLDPRPEVLDIVKLWFDSFGEAPDQPQRSQRSQRPDGR